MNFSVETRRWRRILRLFMARDGEGIEHLTRMLDCALMQTSDCDAKPLIRTWHDMCAIIESVVKAQVPAAVKEMPKL